MELLADAGAVRRFLEFSRQIGLTLDMLEPDLAELANRAREDRLAPSHLIVDLLQLYGIQSGRDDLGVAFSDWVNLRNLGPVSILWDHSPTFHDAMSRTKKYMALENPLLALDIAAEGDEVALVHFLSGSTRYGSSQFLEAVLASTVRIGRLVLGQDWTPLRIEIAHSAPDDQRFKRRFFRCPIHHSQDRYAVVCSREDMIRVSPSVDPHMLAFLEEHLSDAVREWPTDFIHRIEELASAKLAGGHATLPLVALLAGVSERTLQRRLRAAGLSFADILDIVRKRRAEEYFRSERQPNLIQLAYLLGYSDSSTASRFLRTKLGVNSRQLQSQHGKPSGRLLR